MLGLGILGPAVDEHLDLVELVHPDDAFGVLAVAAGLAAVAGRPPGIPLGAVLEVDDLVGVVAREGDLGGAGEVEIVGRQVVDLVGVVVDEAGALHDLGAHQGGRDHRCEAGLDGLGDGQLQQGEFEAGADPGEEVEASAGDLGATLGVDGRQALAEGQMVARLEALGGEIPWRADDFAENIVLFAATGRAGQNDIRDRRDESRELGVGCRSRGVEGLDLVGEFLHLGQQRGLVLALGRGDLLADGPLLGARRLELRQRGPAALVGRQDLIDDRRVVATGQLRAPDLVGVVTQELDVDHARQPIDGSGARCMTAGHWHQRHPGRRTSATPSIHSDVLKC